MQQPPDHQQPNLNPNPYPQNYPPAQQPQPPKKGMSPLMIVLATLGGMVVLGMGSCILCVGAGAKGIADQAKHEEKATEEAKKNVVQVNLGELLTDYKNNEVAGDQKYKGKYIEVSGIANEIKKDFSDDMFIDVGTGAEFEIPTVHCDLGKKGEAVAAKLRKGQRVTVRGIVGGLVMNVQLKGCEVL